MKFLKTNEEVLNLLRESADLHSKADEAAEEFRLRIAAMKDLELAEALIKSEHLYRADVADELKRTALSRLLKREK